MRKTGFALCALALAGVVLTLPQTREAARSIAGRLFGGADIREAVHIMGEGVRGERGFLDALYGAFDAAFLGGGGDMEVSSPGAGDPDGAAEFTGAVRSALMKSRTDYSDGLVPAGAPLG
ncbi:MAG: hypothetical protein LBC21_05460 [Oscillospiraceae bacterium]|jgi:hypothetical protein|nr:hypothetical protein [Oscillospiraceae bacterium]